jgi:hypothetical protein
LVTVWFAAPVVEGSAAVVESRPARVTM